VIGKVIFFIICQIVPLICGDLIIPDRLNDEWIAQKPNKIFVGGDLFNHINGGAELFLEFGFEDLTVCKYNNGSYSLDLEVYKMQNPLAALGIYLSKTGKETPLKGISARNTANPYQIVLTSGQFFILINNFSGQVQFQSLLVRLSQALVSQIGNAGSSPELLSYLPIENQVEESQTIFRGPFGLQSIYTFGKGDVLLLAGKNFGISANYKSENKKTISLIIIPYPDDETANKAFNNLILNLDSYLEIIDRSGDHFVFKDYKNEFGLVRIDKNILKIKIHLQTKPL